MQFLSVDEIARSAITDHEAGEELSPGVVIERRTILRVGLSLGVLAALTSPVHAAGWSGRARIGRDSAGGQEPHDGAAVGRIAVNDLVHQLRPRAQELIASQSPDEEAYLTAVASLLARVQPAEPWRSFPAGKGWEMDTVAYFPPIVLFQIKMNPGSVIHLHDHRHYNGVLLTTEGTTRVRNFDLVAPDGSRLNTSTHPVPGPGQEFLIRRTADTILPVGALSTLSRDRDNIHHVEAGPDGCRLIDFFTHFRPEARSYELAWDGSMYDEAKGLCKVAWKE